jgi:hypothetical protein
MALIVKDRVKETTTTTGTGTVTLAGAVTGFQSFSVIGDGNTTYYAIVLGAEWEVGIGTYTASGTTLSRDVVLESSNSGSLVNFGGGAKDVFVTYPAERSMYVDGSTITPAVAATLGVIFGGTGQSSYTDGQLLIGNSTGNTLAKATLTAGTGISVTNGAGSISIANTAPDQTVVLTAGTGISTSGTYPNFTINNTGVTSFSAGTTGLTPSTGTTGAVTLSGTLAAANGGTGQSSYAVGDLLYASGTTALSKLAGVATGNVLLSGGVATAPAWGKVGLTTHISGTLAIGNGGTGLTAAATNGQLLIGNGTGYTLATVTAGTGISVTNGAGSISIAATNNGTVTSIATNNGITGGTITSTGTIGLTGQALALHNLATNGLIARTGAGTVSGAGGNGILYTYIFRGAVSPLQFLGT